MNETDWKKIREEILLGRANGHLAEIVTACQLAAGGNRVHWRLAVDGLPEVTSQNVTMLEMERVERATGDDWPAIDLKPIVPIRRAKALLAAALVEREGVTGDDLAERLKGVTVEQIVEAFTVYEDGAAPFPQPDPGSATST